jgi:hypothetical protein
MIIMNRRDFLKYAAVGSFGLAAVGDNVSCADDPFDFKCTFQVRIFGKSWVEDTYTQMQMFPEFLRKSLERSTGFSEPVKKRLVFPSGRDVAEFMTLDFDPKKLVMFDVYRGVNRKPAVSNIKENNYQEVILPRDNGCVGYGFRVTSPRLDRQLFEQDFLFMSDIGLLNLALTEPEVAKDHIMVPIDVYKGIYPRAFHLIPDKGGVHYFIYGLESLAGAGTSPDDFAVYFKNRTGFNDFHDYLRFRRKIDAPLKVKKSI